MDDEGKLTNVEAMRDYANECQNQGKLEEAALWTRLADNLAAFNKFDCEARKK